MRIEVIGVAVVSKNKEIHLRFRIGTAGRGVALQKTKTDVYALPGGEELFIATPVMKLIATLEGACSLDDQYLKHIMECIDESGSDRPMVPVYRIGAGPTDKSARFSVQVIQSIDDGSHGSQGKKKEAALTFTLPVSQIETVGADQMAAPLWLILEKLEEKATSKWGARSRTRSNVMREFVPTTLRATTSPRVLALKAWLMAMHTELKQEDECNKIAADLLKVEGEKIAQEYFDKYLSAPETLFALKIQLFKNHGSGLASLFQRKVRESRGV